MEILLSVHNVPLFLVFLWILYSLLIHCMQIPSINFQEHPIIVLLFHIALQWSMCIGVRIWFPSRLTGSSLSGLTCSLGPRTATTQATSQPRRTHSECTQRVGSSWPQPSCGGCTRRERMTMAGWARRYGLLLPTIFNSDLKLVFTRSCCLLCRWPK